MSEAPCEALSKHFKWISLLFFMAPRHSGDCCLQGIHEETKAHLKQLEKVFKEHQFEDIKCWIYPSLYFTKRLFDFAINTYKIPFGKCWFWLTPSLSKGELGPSGWWCQLPTTTPHHPHALSVDLFWHALGFSRSALFSRNKMWATPGS